MTQLENDYERGHYKSDVGYIDADNLDTRGLVASLDELTVTQASALSTVSPRLCRDDP